MTYRAFACVLFWLPALARAQAAAEEPPPEPPPEEATSSVVVDERQAELEAEQAAVQEQDLSSTQPVARDEEGDDSDLDHEYQVGIRAGAGVPFVFALRYGDGAPCDRDGSPFCVFVGSGIVDVDVSFGATRDLEITAMFRIGMIGQEPSEQNAMMFGLGIRSYLSPESLFKFYLGARLMLDFTQSGMVDAGDWGPVDFGVRGEAGVQLDVVRYVGFFIQLGVNVTFLRAFGISPDLTGGFQIRFP